MKWWAKISGQSLMQGDLVPDCLLTHWSVQSSSSIKTVGPAVR